MRNKKPKNKIELKSNENLKSRKPRSNNWLKNNKELKSKELSSNAVKLSNIMTNSNKLFHPWKDLHWTPQLTALRSSMRYLPH